MSKIYSLTVGPIDQSIKTYVFTPLLICLFVGLYLAKRLIASRVREHTTAHWLGILDPADIWCSEVLEHLFAPLSVLVEIHRTLRPGGVALVTVPYHGLVKNIAIALFADKNRPSADIFALGCLGFPFFTGIGLGDKVAIFDAEDCVR